MTDPNYMAQAQVSRFEHETPAIIVETKSEEFIRDQIMETWRMSYEHRRPHYERFMRYYRLYRSWLNPRLDPEEWRSRLFIPLPFAQLETIEPRVMSVYFGKNELMHVAANLPQFEPFEEGVQLYINNRLMNTMKQFWPFLAGTKSAMLYGDMFMKQGYEDIWARQDTRVPMTIEDPFTGEKMVVGSRIVKNKPIAISTGPYSDNVDNFDLSWVPARDLQLSDGIFHVTRRTLFKLRQESEMGMFSSPDKVANIREGDGIDPDTDEFYARRMETSTRGYSWASGHDVIPYQRAQHHVIEAQMHLDLGLGRYRKIIAHVVDMKHLINVEEFWSPDGKWTYLRTPYTDVPGEDTGIGLMEQLENITYAINDEFNIAQDNALRILNQTYLMDPTLFLSPDQFETRPGGIHPVIPGGLEKGRIPLMPIEERDLPKSYYDARGFLIDLAQRVTGVSDYFSGLNTAAAKNLNQTATGVSILHEQAASRTELFFQQLHHGYWNPLCQRVLCYDQEYMDVEEWVRVTGKPGMDWFQVTPDKLLGSYDFNFANNYAQKNEAKERDDFMVFYKLLLEAAGMGIIQPLNMGGIYDFDELHRRAFDLLGQKNISSIIKQMTNPLQAAAAGGMPPEQLLAMGFDPLDMASQMPGQGQLPMAQGAADKAGYTDEGMAAR